ncbi:alpha-D-ribose 1-methylphosphonate 5-triphosphate diphosphatase [Phaeobacter gallaeciensis]|uniref:alpha-D-ribose 1-methylphosphonate 5-triphosphate diphosphatase n=1 Tax=Phaeobacter gallaeciensis TaxID=60890 RepID=UPI00237FC033|nr:alpha-D-ribose 1-methylphosphonate 5-triphosphate diphosphatase [Phaeobacter gallaeciensis]MDE4190224.1 alpha-D-ribose 1-methylphosphonate 5-triphosphate diphosphatase [Phaeobacter gallaeciensis]MDE4198283.1 alpha-D-ribose 1-methylphosphonate 5-triphosphate diphosphatase [Phaeobacter gallaeciensis]MDE4202426.1 alpha-D-ribose 1-methylphosphonate 5-triphosphate diphosphatase [Phaeobacter gallaeciensis]MDE4206275.1 alpha-D-ribose 1-methylphosphonate 5-triphosphate diphosphatase [Phaeobacter gal
MTQEMILANATLVLPGETRIGSLRIKDGEIADMAEGADVPTGAVDCGGDFVSPGLIELHTDNLERHIQPRPKVDWPHAAAIIAHDAELAGTGITTVFDALRVGSIKSKEARYGQYARSLASELLELRGKDALKISHFLHLRAEVCSETLVDELNEFTDEDRVGLVSLMDHTPGQRQFRDISKLEAYVKGKHGFDDDAFLQHVANLKTMRDTYGDLHEVEAVKAAQRFGAVLASHDDTTEDQVAVSAGHGIRLAEFPTTVEAARACHAHDIQVMMGAPNLIRGGSHSGNVAAQELAELDLLDIVSSDYVPAALLLAAAQLGEIWGDMARGLATVTSAPAKAVGLKDRGLLEIGKRADLIRFAMRAGVPALQGVYSRGQRVA